MGGVVIQDLDYIYNIEMSFEINAQNHFFEFKALPRDTSRQKIVKENISIDPNTKLSRDCDNFKNKYVYGKISEPHSRFSFCVSGTVKTGLALYEEDYRDDGSVFLFRTQSEYTFPGDTLKKYHDDIMPDVNKLTYNRVIEYMNILHNDFKYQKSVTDINTTAEKAASIGKGVCQDYAHILLSLCRMDRIPARYVVGLMTGEGESHAWIEALCGNVWIGFDPTNNLLVNDGYIKISHGRDFKDCTVNKGIFNGGGKQLQNITVKVEPAEEK